MSLNIRVFLKSMILIIGFVVIASSQVHADHVIMSYLTRFSPLCIGPNQRDIISVVNTSANFSDDNNNNGNNQCIINLVKVQAFDPETGVLIGGREARNIEPGLGVNLPITDTLPASYFSLLMVHVEVSPIGNNGVNGEKGIPFIITRSLCGRNGGTILATEGLPMMMNGGDLCENGNPQVLSMEYTGEDCNNTHHSQDPDSVNCEDFGALLNTVFIVADDNPGNIFFSGEVNLDETFDIVATNATLPSTTFINIFDREGGRILQTVEFHTSCSQPLMLGDQFGSVQLVGFVPENN